MATFNSDTLTSTQNDYSPQTTTSTLTGVFTVPDPAAGGATLAAGNTVAMLKIPAGYMVTDGFIHTDGTVTDLVTTIDIGVAADVDNYIDGLDGNASATGTGAVFGFSGAGATFNQNHFVAETEVLLTFVTLTITTLQTAGTKINLVVNVTRIPSKST